MELSLVAEEYKRAAWLLIGREQVLDWICNTLHAQEGPVMAALHTQLEETKRTDSTGVRPAPPDAH